MAKHRAGGPAHPWRRTVRTGFQFLVAFAPVAPQIYQAATQQDPATAGGLAGTGLVVMLGVTRVMGLPAVEQLLQRFAPWMAADDVDVAEVDQANAVVRHLRATTVPATEVAVRVADAPGLGFVAGPASSIPDGTPVAVERA